MILIVFGSKSDARTYHAIANGLRKNGIDFELHICSAHRTPERLNELLNKKWSLVIAGAGLAAHLPGVVASKIEAPVIGVPTIGAFEGLDAFLAIVQMPPGIPVLGVSPDAVDSIIEAAVLFHKKPRHLLIRGLIDSAPARKAMEVLEKLGVAYSIGPMPNALAVNFVHLGESAAGNGIYCPVQEKTDKQDSIEFMESAKKGLWVGINNGENAAIAAAQMIGERERVMAYRKSLRAKVIKDDEEEQKCLHEN